MQRLLRGPSPDWVGKHQWRVRQALIALGAATTRQLFEYVWPHLDPDKRWPNWRWCRVRCAAERFAVRVEPRTRAKPGLGMLDGALMISACPLLAEADMRPAERTQLLTHCGSRVAKIAVMHNTAFFQRCGRV